MRLQSAIFTLEDTLFTPDGAAREGLDKALALFKMEGVWLGAVTALRAEEAQKALERAGLSSYFRFVLTEQVALCKVGSATMFERAMKRLHGQKDDTAVFSGSLAAIEQAGEAGFRTVAVRGARCAPPRRRALKATASCWDECANGEKRVQAKA